MSGQYFGEVLLRGSTVVKYGLSGGTVVKYGLWDSTVIKIGCGCIIVVKYWFLGMAL